MKALLLELRGDLQQIIDLTHRIQVSGVNGEAAALNREIRETATMNLAAVNTQLLAYEL